MAPHEQTPQEEAPRKRKPPLKLDEIPETLSVPSAATSQQDSEPPVKIPKVDGSTEPPKPEVERTEAPPTPLEVIDGPSSEVNQKPPAEVKPHVPEPPPTQPRPEEFWQDRQEFQDSPATALTRYDSQGTLLSLSWE